MAQDDANSDSPLHDRLSHERDQSSPLKLEEEAQQEEPLEEASVFDADEYMDGDFESTQSLTSSVLDYTYENGRRYHAFRKGQYFMPNDEHEQEGMDLMHHVSCMILKGELYRAPVQCPLSILEIGTGTGIWAIDVADKFPGAYVVATDLSPIQPGWIPPNLEFQIDDCESEWTFDKEFDFIHMRNLSGSIADWPKLIDTCYHNLKPGGWLEISNIEAWGKSNNDSLVESSASYEWQTNLKAAASAFGRELNIGPDLEALIKQAGFKDVFDDQHKVPMSSWWKEKVDLARYFQELVLIELEALSLRLFTAVLGWEVERLQLLLAGVRNEIKNTDYQMYSVMHYVCGKKPQA